MKNNNHIIRLFAYTQSRAVRAANAIQEIFDKFTMGTSPHHLSHEDIKTLADASAILTRLSFLHEPHNCDTYLEELSSTYTD